MKQEILTLLQSDGFLFVVRSSLILTFSLVLARLAKRASGQWLHHLWSVTFLVLLLLAPLSMVLPQWRLGVIPSSKSSVSAPVSNPSVSVTNGLQEADQAKNLVFLEPESLSTGNSSASGELPGPPATTHIPWALVLWCLGSIVSLVPIPVGLLACRRMQRRSHPIEDSRWNRWADEIRGELLIRRNVELRQSPDRLSPMTGGVLSPYVLLPHIADTWSDERCRLVLQHELIHVARYDVLRNALVRFCVALYWFHPLVWLASRRAAAARELACDETVLDLGAKASSYANHLFEIANDLTLSHRPTLALAMIERTPLEDRLMAILQPRRGFRGTTASLSISMMLTILLVSVASANPAPKAPETPIAPVSDHATVPLVPALAPSAPLSDLEETSPTPPPSPTMHTSPPAPPNVVAPASAVPAPSVRPAHAPSGECWSRNGVRGSFRGSMTTHEGSYTQLVGFHDGDLVIQQDVLGARLCLRAEGDVELGENRGEILHMGNDAVLYLDSESGDKRLQLTIRAGMQPEWKVNQVSKPFDEEAQAWQDQMLAVMSGLFRAQWIRGEESSLRGQISSLHGERSSLKGQIASLYGEQSSLRGEISSFDGHSSSLRGEISSIRGRESSLRGQISSHRGTISSLRAHERYGPVPNSDQAAEIARLEEAIAETELEIARYDADRRVAEVERELARLAVEDPTGELESQIEDLEIERRVAETEAEMASLETDKQVAEIERKIEELDADRRASQIEEELESEARELKRLIEQIG